MFSATMSVIPPDDYVSAGYLIASPSSSERILSACDRLCAFFPHVWAIEWASVTHEDRLRNAATLGFDAAALPAIVSWATDNLSRTFGWSNVFYSLDAARETTAKLVPQTTKTVILGLALHNSDVSAFLNDSAPPPRAGETGLFECLRAGAPPAPGGETLGFELLASMFGVFTCSWLCGSLDETCEQKLGIKTNHHRFVPAYTEAARCAEFISRPGTPAEPGLWLPWLVTTYSPSAQQEPS
jgi:hypothetical protein